MRVAGSVSFLRQLMKDPPKAFDAGCTLEHVFKCASVVNAAREPQQSSSSQWGRGKI